MNGSEFWVERQFLKMKTSFSFILLNTFKKRRKIVNFAVKSGILLLDLKFFCEANQNFGCEAKTLEYRK